MAALKSRRLDMEATVIGSLFQKLMTLTKKEYLYTLIRECLHISALYSYLYKKQMGKKCHHHKLTLKPRVIGIGKEMIEIEKSTKERLHIM